MSFAESFATTYPEEICLRTSPRIVREAFDAVRRRLESTARQGYDLSRVYLVLDEVISNVYRHGYGGRDGQPIGVRVRVHETFCHLAVRDRAPVFDAARHAASRPLPDPTLGKPGGMGLTIIQTSCETFEHRVNTEGGNSLYLVLRLTKSSADKKDSPPLTSEPSLSRRGGAS